MFNLAYEVVTQPIKHLALNYVESNYPSTRRSKDPVKLIQEHVELVGVANTMKELAKAVFVACAVAPVAEELIFRGALQSGTTWMTGNEGLGVLTSTALFALSHYNNNKNPLDIAFQLADCYFIYNPARASGGLLASMAAHSFHNLSSFLPFFIVGLYPSNSQKTP